VRNDREKIPGEEDSRTVTAGILQPTDPWTSVASVCAAADHATWKFACVKAAAHRGSSCRPRRQVFAEDQALRGSFRSRCFQTWPYKVIAPSVPSLRLYVIDNNDLTNHVARRENATASNDKGCFPFHRDRHRQGRQVYLCGPRVSLR
jgi:hypothetical protein